MQWLVCCDLTIKHQIIIDVVLRCDFWKMNFEVAMSTFINLKAIFEWLSFNKKYLSAKVYLP